MCKMTNQQFELRRRTGGITYHYHPCESNNDKSAWKRADKEIWLVWLDACGWVFVDAEQRIGGVPWGIPISHQGPMPPTGEWVSKKLDKAYVYDLVFIAQ